jgi:hypothetical protein
MPADLSDCTNFTTPFAEPQGRATHTSVGAGAETRLTKRRGGVGIGGGPRLRFASPAPKPGGFGLRLRLNEEDPVGSPGKGRGAGWLRAKQEERVASGLNDGTSTEWAERLTNVLAA